MGTEALSLVRLSTHTPKWPGSAPGSLYSRGGESGLGAIVPKPPPPLPAHSFLEGMLGVILGGVLEGTGLLGSLHVAPIDWMALLGEKVP